MEDEFADLQRLLSIKRHEAPPPEYFEDFLFEFQQRQRAEMLKRSLWRLALDRFEGAMPSFSFARTAYTSASGMAFTAALVMTARIVTMPATATAPMAVAAKSAHVGKTRANSGIALAASAAKFDFDSSRHTFRLPATDFDQQPRPMQASLTRTSRPRYVLDTQPVSYAPSSTF